MENKKKSNSLRRMFGKGTARILLRLAGTAAGMLLTFNQASVSAQEKISHSFLALGAKTYIVSEAGKVEWTYPFGTRDGWMLPDGHLLLTLSKCDEYPGGAVVE